MYIHYTGYEINQNDFVYNYVDTNASVCTDRTFYFRTRREWKLEMELLISFVNKYLKYIGDI